MPLEMMTRLPAAAVAAGVATPAPGATGALGSTGGSLVYQQLDFVQLPDGRTVRIGRQLGRGEHGHVYLAELETRYVVVKILRPGLMRTEKELEFVRENEISMQLVHPSIVTFLGAGRRPPMEREGQEPYMVLEYAGSRTLRDLFRQVEDALIPMQQLVAIGLDIAGALAHLHNLKIGHFDVNPSNIMVDAAGKVRLGDFSLARREADHDFAAYGGATPAYCAPEALRGEQCFKSDVWSLGIVLYELMTAGQMPFRPLTSPQAMRDLLLKSSPVPIPARFKLSSPLLVIISDMLTKEADRRPSAAVVRARLAALLSQLRPPTAAEPVEPPPERAPSPSTESASPAASSEPAAAAASPAESVSQPSSQPEGDIAAPASPSVALPLPLERPLAGASQTRIERAQGPQAILARDVRPALPVARNSFVIRPRQGLSTVSAPSSSSAPAVPPTNSGGARGVSDDLRVAASEAAGTDKADQEPRPELEQVEPPRAEGDERAPAETQQQEQQPSEAADDQVDAEAPRPSVGSHSVSAPSSPPPAKQHPATPLRDPAAVLRTLHRMASGKFE